MKRVAILAAFVLLFLIANRGAYEGYFQDDELDNIGWTRDASWKVFAAGLATPRFYESNFRPPGHAFFKLMERAAQLHFPPYVAGIHALHLLNVVLVWLLLGRLRLPPLAAGAGALFFGFHMAVFDAYWKPMYVFDVLCALFSLAALVAWTHRRWVLSLGCFWLAYKSKELAIMLPAALAAYEFWLSEETGRRRWLRLAPFCAVSLLFGIQALLHRPEGENAYRFAFNLAALLRTAPFYASRLLLIPYAGFALLALPLVVRDRRTWFGLAATLLFLAPLLFLPGRLYSAYLYLPLALLAIALAACAARVPWWAVAAFFVLWLPWNYHLLRLDRRAALTVAHENRAYVAELFRVAATLPEPRVFVVDLAPPAFHRWGIEGALHYFYRSEVRVFGVDDKGLAESTAGKELALLSWHPAE
ncbi:MAG: hypothetical protein HY822_21425, partial [Acidobacteria bacterium]|nr:hypothetical protein [Acidobacteriota bacterium]